MYKRQVLFGVFLLELTTLNQFKIKGLIGGFEIIMPLILLVVGLIAGFANFGVTIGLLITIAAFLLVDWYFYYYTAKRLRNWTEGETRTV